MLLYRQTCKFMLHINYTQGFLFLLHASENSCSGYFWGNGISPNLNTNRKIISLPKKSDFSYALDGNQLSQICGKSRVSWKHMTTVLEFWPGHLKWLWVCPHYMAIIGVFYTSKNMLHLWTPLQLCEAGRVYRHEWKGHLSSQHVEPCLSQHTHHSSLCISIFFSGTQACLWQNLLWPVS